MKNLNIRKNYIGVMLLLAACFLLAFPVNAQAKPKLNKTNLNVAKGVIRKLKVTGASSKVTWKSSNKKVATVTNQGSVTGRKTGTATIKAKVGGTTFKCKVKVTNPKLNKTNITLYSDYERPKYQLKVKGTDSKVTWKSSNKKIATVSKKGLVKAKLVSYETATIQAVVDGKTLKCKVKVYFGTYDEKWDKIGKQVENYVKSKGGVVCHNLKELKASNYNTSPLSLFSTWSDFLHGETRFQETGSYSDFIGGTTISGNVKVICKKFDSFKEEPEEYDKKYFGIDHEVKCGIYIERSGKINAESNTWTKQQLLDAGYSKLDSEIYEGRGYAYSYYFWWYFND